ncbi:hypothetical protein PanWU01x14_224430, partial [Parasponia andersonii]
WSNFFSYDLFLAKYQFSLEKFSTLISLIRSKGLSTFFVRQHQLQPLKWISDSAFVLLDAIRCRPLFSSFQINSLFEARSSVSFSPTALALIKASKDFGIEGGGDIFE